MAQRGLKPRAQAGTEPAAISRWGRSKAGGTPSHVSSLGTDLICGETKFFAGGRTNLKGITQWALSLTTDWQRTPPVPPPLAADWLRGKNCIIKEQIPQKYLYYYKSKC